MDEIRAHMAGGCNPGIGELPPEIMEYPLSLLEVQEDFRAMMQDS